MCSPSERSAGIWLLGLVFPAFLQQEKNQRLVLESLQWPCCFGGAGAREAEPSGKKKKIKKKELADGFKMQMSILKAKRSRSTEELCPLFPVQAGEGSPAGIKRKSG